MDPSIRPLRNGHPVETEEQENAKTAIWWDIMNFPLPDIGNPRWVVNNFLKALQEAKFRGEVSIFVYGNFKILELQTEMSTSGLTFIHVPGGEDELNMKMITNMLLLMEASDGKYGSEITEDITTSPDFLSVLVDPYGYAAIQSAKTYSNGTVLRTCNNLIRRHSDLLDEK